MKPSIAIYVAVIAAAAVAGATQVIGALPPPDAPMSPQSKLRAKLEAGPAIHPVRVRTDRVAGPATMPWLGWWGLSEGEKTMILRLPKEATR